MYIFSDGYFSYSGTNSEDEKDLLHMRIMAGWSLIGLTCSQLLVNSTVLIVVSLRELRIKIRFFWHKF
jgi:hypothetical protein